MNNITYFYNNDEKNNFKIHEAAIKEGLGIRLFNIEKKYSNNFSEEEKEIIYNLKDEIINDLPLLGAYCKNKCILKEVKFNRNLIEYRFIFQRESFKVKDGRPIKIISELLVECKHYIDKNIAAVVPCFEPEADIILKIACTISEYIKLKTKPGFAFRYSPHNYKEIILDAEQIQLVQSFLKDNMTWNEEEIEGRKLYIIRIDNIENESTLLKTSMSKGKNKLIRFYNKYDKNQKLVIMDKGVIVTTFVLEGKTFNEIVKLIHFIYNNSDAKDFLIPIDKTIEEYCKSIHKEMTIEGIERQKRIVRRDLKQLIVDSNGNNIFGTIYSTIVFNMLIKLCMCVDKVGTLDENIEIDILDYEHIVNFLYVYSRKISKLNIKESDIENVILRIVSILKEPSKSEEKLIFYYKNLCR